MIEANMLAIAGIIGALGNPPEASFIARLFVAQGALYREQ